MLNKIETKDIPILRWHKGFMFRNLPFLGSCNVTGRLETMLSVLNKEDIGPQHQHWTDLRLLAVRKGFPNTLRLRVQMQLARGTNVRIGLETIRQRLLEDNLHIRCPHTGPLAHRQARLQFAENHTRWNDNEWARVLFSDESRFCLELSDRRVRVIRRPNERYAQCNILGRQPCEGGISLNNMWYHLPHLSGIISSSSMIMQDRTVHSLTIMSEYLNEVENAWDMMGRHDEAPQPPPAKLGKIRGQIIAIWDNQDQANVLSTINSIGTQKSSPSNDLEPIRTIFFDKIYAFTRSLAFSRQEISEVKAKKTLPVIGVFIGFGLHFLLSLMLKMKSVVLIVGFVGLALAQFPNGRILEPPVPALCAQRIVHERTPDG
ncbi:hypothetical protein GEV33_004016 [Tenebrio molitor]|uniref:Transposase Tc1-like domain-containing protein n=1 Tax=Tenebrio molitor TaxID=7067 RepID=A0A8J6HQ92_TENMO|nr:hypothetical protein GEV33_004016 [Tenebrio molitor]